MTKSEIKKLEERVRELGSNPFGPQLSSVENYEIQMFWVQLHYTPEEWAEYSTLEKQHDTLYEQYLAGNRSQELTDEWEKIGKRELEILHSAGGVMQRVERNRPMRTRIWPELAPRVLRYWKLKEKPGEELTIGEKEELEALLDWFGELQQEALESVGVQ